MIKKNGLVTRFKKLNQRIMILFVLFFTLGTIKFAQQQQFVYLPSELSRGLQVIISVVIAALTASLFLRLTTRYMLRIWADNVDVEYRIILAKLYSVIIYFIATFTILYILGIDTSNITILLGFMTTGLAFAIRDILMSYLAWYILLAKRPFRIGDYISVGDESGKVLHIGTFFVLLDDTPEKSDDYVRIPNKTFLEKPVRNLGKKEVCFTTKMEIKFYPDDYVSRREKMLLELKDYTASPEVFLDTCGEKLFVTCSFYCDYQKRREVKDIVVGLLYSNFKDCVEKNV